MVEINQVENIDKIKIYIYITTGITLISLVFFLYNFVKSKQYEKRIRQGMSDISEAYEHEKRNPPKEKQKVIPAEIKDMYSFFQKTIQLSETPQVEASEWEPGNEEGSIFQEKSYVVRFEKINRYDLSRYIFKIQESKPYLKIKRLDMQRSENVKPYEDVWKTEVVFAFRMTRVE